VDSDGNAELIFSAAGLESTITQAINLSPNRVAVVVPNVSKLSAKLTGKTGLFSGRFRHPVTNESVAFEGVLLQKQSSGSGGFRTKSASGSVQLQLKAN
jgi:hypothetical protein